jgi:large subunit ribosomal protein L1
MDSIIKAKPQKAKGVYIKAISMSTSMGPGIKVEVAK